MTEIFNLKVGDLFIYKGTVYEIIAKSKWTSLCGYLNDKYRFGDWVNTCIVILVIIQKWKYEKI